MGLFDKVFDDILGFDPPKQQQGQVSTLTANQAGLEQELTALALGQRGSPPIGDPGRVFPGQFSAGASPLQQQAFGLAGGLPQQFASTGAQANKALLQLLNPQAQGGALDAIFGRGQEMFGRESERIANKFGGMNATSSSGARDAQNRALEQFTLASQAQAAPYALQSKLGALPQLFVNQNQQAGLANILGQFGTQQRGIANEQLGGERQKFDLQDPTRSPQTQLGLGLLGGNFAQPFLTETQGTGSSLLGGLGGLLGQEGGMAALGGNISSAVGGLGSLLGGALSFI